MSGTSSMGTDTNTEKHDPTVLLADQLKKSCQVRQIRQGGEIDKVHQDERLRVRTRFLKTSNDGLILRERTASLRLNRLDEPFGNCLRTRRLETARTGHRTRAFANAAIDHRLPCLWTTAWSNSRPPKNEPTAINTSAKPRVCTTG